MDTQQDPTPAVWESQELK